MMCSPYSLYLPYAEISSGRFEKFIKIIFLFLQHHYSIKSHLGQNSAVSPIVGTRLPLSILIGFKR